MNRVLPGGAISKTDIIVGVEARSPNTDGYDCGPTDGPNCNLPLEPTSAVPSLGWDLQGNTSARDASGIPVIALRNN